MPMIWDAYLIVARSTVFPHPLLLHYVLLALRATQTSRHCLFARVLHRREDSMGLVAYISEYIYENHRRSLVIAWCCHFD
jgi:hypothetical protein